MFLKNAWYVAAWSEEVSRALLARRLLDIPVVLYRTEDGAPVALHDRCPHRFAYLHTGKLVGDAVECGYHGLRFDRSGACVRSPYTDRPPPNANVESFPVVERHGAIWFWPGERAAVDEALIPEHPHLVDPQYGQAKGHDMFAGNYLLGVDNLMELTHLFFLHTSTIGAGREDGRPPGGETYEVEMIGETALRSRTFTPGHPRTTAISDGVDDKAELIDRWNEIRWDAPSNMRFDICSTPAGGPREAPPYMVQSHFITPETGRSSHYFWAASRTFDLGPEADARYVEFFGNIFRTEDRPMLEDIQAQMGKEDLFDLKPVILPRDKGAVLARQTVARLIQREQASSPRQAAE
jgi:vanillate O-demethylase monooxygenase subunit